MSTSQPPKGQPASDQKGKSANDDRATSLNLETPEGVNAFGQHLRNQVSNLHWEIPLLAEALKQKDPEKKKSAKKKAIERAKELLKTLESIPA